MNFRNFKFFLLLFFFNSCSKEELKNPNSNIPISGVTPSTQFSSKLNSNETANDILFNQQWYLKNTGQMTYFNEKLKEGIDLNISYPQKYTGKGVKVLVVDTGVYFDHPNLAPNLLENYSLDFSDSSLGSKKVSKPKIDKKENPHGTKVAGILAGAYTKENGFRGVAPDAKIASANVMSYLKNLNQISYKDMALKLYNHIEKNKVQIVSESLGYSGFEFNFLHENIDSLEISEKNFFTIRSSGNYTCANALAQKYLNKNPSIKNEVDNFEFKNLESSKKLSPLAKTYFKAIRPHLSSMDIEKSNPYRITVGGINHQGILFDRSSIGSNIWISGFAGDKASDLIHSSKAETSTPIRILTTTMPESKNENAKTDFDKGLLPENKKGFYTTEAAGTSMAAPMISGVIALILEANPNLSYWDVKYILAKTANREILAPDPIPYCIKILNIIGDFSSNFMDLWKIEWVKNKAGYFFHNYYGFGLVDADKAVKMALKMKRDEIPSPYKGKTIVHIKNMLHTNYQVIPPNSGIISELEIKENLIIDAVRVSPYINAEKADSVAIQLVSPDHISSKQLGTRSTILYPGNSMIRLSTDELKVENASYTVNEYNSSAYKDIGAYLTNAFYAEQSQGKWKIIISNSSLDKTFYLDGWKLEIYGH
ncbi:S8 family serine peptidase [Silvanigrella aquatica]|uniref:P/Homo B domain-containing protein n=1 Tax=Silvanigrella aquatica TaxID=1915309 RepID=A0A1L4CXD4_9BACT|nr:S8 family serine peptidase [Silvanigrella aquatica]APJ02611.1 hypothetical protein AXG55_01145 [Silvanigrella aquatica]